MNMEKAPKHAAPSACNELNSKAAQLPTTLHQVVQHVVTRYNKRCIKRYIIKRYIIKRCNKSFINTYMPMHHYASRYNMVAVILCHLADLLQVYQHNLRRATEGHSGLVICKAQGAMHIVQIRTKNPGCAQETPRPHRTFVFLHVHPFPHRTKQV